MMDRVQFMEALERLLLDISEAERQEALTYYENYFDDAGPENEAKVIQELGSPGKVAAMIKADLKGNNDAYAEYTENGYEDSRNDKAQQLPTENKRNRFQGKRDGIIILCLIFLVFISPFLKGFAGGLFGFLIAILFIPFWLMLGFGAGGIALGFTAIAIVIVGISICAASPAVAILIMGIGFVLLAFGLLLVTAATAIGGKIIPKYIRWITDKISNLLHRKRNR